MFLFDYCTTDQVNFDLYRIGGGGGEGFTVRFCTVLRCLPYS